MVYVPNPVDPTEPTITEPISSSAAEFRALKQYIQDLVSNGAILGPGDMVWKAYGGVLPGLLFCDGSAVSRVTYAALFAKINISFGPGDGATTFNIPDIKARTVYGVDPGNSTGRLTGAYAGGISAGTIGLVGGEQGHQLSVAELAAHNHVINVGDPGHTHAWVGNAHAHGISDPGHQHVYSAITPTAGPALAAGTGATSTLQATNIVGTGISINNATVTGGNVAAATGVFANSNNAGSNSPHNNVPPGIVLVPYIKT